MRYIYKYKYKYIYIYNVASCITYFKFYLAQTGSRVSVGVGSWSGMLEVVGSSHLCVPWSIHVAQTIFGNSHIFLENVKFPTNHTFHRNFHISTWEIFSGNLTCMLE
jgi:hypothetical protein